MKRLAWIALLLLAGPAFGQEPANALLLVAKPGLADANFRETVVLVTQAADASTVGVILNRPTPRKHPSGEPLYFGGPVMREVVVALYRAERAPESAAFHVLQGVYLSMHPLNIEPLLGKGGRGYRLFSGFAGWAPGQLQNELARGDWHVLPANAELAFRDDTGGMWEELVRKARGRVATR